MKKAAVPSILAAVVLLALGVTADAQQPKKVSRLGYLGLIEIPERDEAFRKGLRERGYTEGQNIHVEYRFAGGRVERLAELAPELVRLNVDVIVTTGTQVTDAAKRATKTIPIVFATTLDPVASGFVASFARPGGNLTVPVHLMWRQPENVWNCLERRNHGFLAWPCSRTQPIPPPH